MIQLAFLLMGTEAVRRHWIALAAVGGIWLMVGVVVASETFEGVNHYTLHLLGFLLVIEGCATLLARALGHRSRMWLTKASILIVPGIAIMETSLRSLMAISITFGCMLAVDSIVRTSSILLLRFRGWQIALVGTATELVLAVLAITPWPVTYEATIPFCVGVALVLSGWTVIRSANVLRRLPLGAPITSLPIFEHERGWNVAVAPFAATLDLACPQKLVVHVWTPVASATNPLHRPLIDRYIAAVDRQGTVATGHAALEMLPHVYVSHYGVLDADRTGAEFRAALDAGSRNDVAGRFLPGYAAEAAEWCEATAHVEFQNFSAERLHAFWKNYQQNTTYNLTNRNCSVAVALALDAALEGALAPKTKWPSYLWLLVQPELYFATLLRQRARTMTWTPGLVLDYARMLHRIVEPVTLPRPAMFYHMALRWRSRLWSK